MAMRLQKGLRANQFGQKQLEGFCEDLGKVLDLHVELYKENIEAKHQGVSYSKGSSVPVSAVLRTIGDIKADRVVKEKAAQDLVRYVHQLQQFFSAGVSEDEFVLLEQRKMAASSAETERLSAVHSAAQFEDVYESVRYKVVPDSARFRIIDELPVIQLELRRAGSAPGQQSVSVQICALPDKGDVPLQNAVKEILGFGTVEQVVQYQRCVDRIREFFADDVVNSERRQFIDYLAPDRGSLVRVFASQVRVQSVFELCPASFSFDYQKLFRVKKQLSKEIALLMVVHETLLPKVETQMYKRSVDVNTGRLVSYFRCPLTVEYPIDGKSVDQNLQHSLHVGNQIMHQSVTQPSDDSIHTNYCQIDKYTLAFLQPHCALGWISTELAKFMRNLGMRQSVRLSCFQKHVLCYDQTQVTAGNIMSDLV